MLYLTCNVLIPSISKVYFMFTNLWNMNHDVNFLQVGFTHVVDKHSLKGRFQSVTGNLPLCTEVVFCRFYGVVYFYVHVFQIGTNVCVTWDCCYKILCEGRESVIHPVV